MTVDEYIKRNGLPDGIVTEEDALWDKNDGEITEEWLLKKLIKRTNSRTLVVC
ncbi:MAG: hypothetical protein ABTA16_16965 [Niallia sp.]